MPDLQREQGMNAARRNRGAGRGIVFAGVFLQMDALRPPPSSRGCAPRITPAESRKPKIPQRSCLLLSPAGSRRIAVSLQGKQQEVPRPAGFPFPPRDTGTRQGWGLSNSQNGMSL